LIESGVKLKKLEVCWSIEGQNAYIQNQRSKGKKRPTSGLTFGFGRDAIELVFKIKILNEDLFGNWHFFAPFYFKWNDAKNRGNRERKTKEKQRKIDEKNRKNREEQERKEKET
jgi:hypothetical protein